MAVCLQDKITVIHVWQLEYLIGFMFLLEFSDLAYLVLVMEHGKYLESLDKEMLPRKWSNKRQYRTTLCWIMGGQRLKKILFLVYWVVKEMVEKENCTFRIARLSR